jgi:hypothetical protein
VFGDLDRVRWRRETATQRYSAGGGGGRLWLEGRRRSASAAKGQGPDGNIASPAFTALGQKAPGSARRLGLEEFGKLRERRIRVQSQADPGCRFAKGGMDVHHLVDTCSTLQE